MGGLVAAASSPPLNLSDPSVIKRLVELFPDSVLVPMPDPGALDRTGFDGSVTTATTTTGMTVGSDDSDGGKRSRWHTHRGGMPQPRPDLHLKRGDRPLHLALSSNARE